MSADQLNGKEFLTFNVVASHPETLSGTASVLISIPEKVCPIDETPTFENRLYHFWLSSFDQSASLSIGKVAATSLATDGSLSYRLLIEDGTLLLINYAFPIFTFGLKNVCRISTSSFANRFINWCIVVCESNCAGHI